MTTILAGTCMLSLFFSQVAGVTFPMILNNKTEFSINDGEYNRTIVCDVKGDPIPSVTWELDGNILDKNGPTDKQFFVTDNASLVVNNPKSSTRYGLINVSCIANNTNGTAKKVFQIWLTKVPFIANNKTEFQIDDGEYNRIIVCDARGNPAPSVFWEFDGKRLYGKNELRDKRIHVTDNESLVVNNPKSSIRYGLINITCIANNTYNNTAMKVFKIWLIKAPRILGNNSETNVNELNAFLLLHISCEATGYPKPNVEWRFGQHVCNFSQDCSVTDIILVDPKTGNGHLPHYKVLKNGTLEIYDLFSKKRLAYKNFTCVAQNIAGKDNRTHTFERLISYKFEVTLPLKQLDNLEEEVDKKISSVFQSGKLFHSKKISSINKTTGTVKFELFWKEQNLKEYYGDPIRNTQKIANDVYTALDKGGLSPSHFIMDEKPAPPTNLIASEIKSDGFTLSWEHPMYFVVTYYQVQILEGSTIRWKNINKVDGAKTTTILDKLDHETKYQVQIYSMNNKGFGEQPSKRLVVKTEAGFPVTIVVIVVVLLLVIFLFILGVIYYQRRKKKTRDTLIQLQQQEQPENPYNDSIPGVSFENIYIRDGRTFCPAGGGQDENGEDFFSWNEIPRTNLILGNVLGKGEFGLVAKAIWQNVETNNNVPVAVKTVQEHATETDRKELFKELKLMADIAEHPNVVNLLGACSREGPLWVVVEFCEYGNLLSYLKKHRKILNENEDSFVTSIEPLIRVRFAYDVSKGMSYLEEKKIVHRDLAARNVLLGKNRIAKVSDFGLSRDIYEVGLYQKTTAGKLPVKWMAIESIQEATYTPKSDVWSFGILFWEIETAGMVPYPGISGLDLLPHLKNGYRLQKPEETLPEMYDLMLTCWEASPKVRPSFQDLQSELEKYIENMSDYLPVIIDEEKDEEHSYVNYVQPIVEEESTSTSF